MNERRNTRPRPAKAIGKTPTARITNPEAVGIRLPTLSIRRPHRTTRSSQRTSQRESGRYAGMNRPCWKRAAVWRPVTSTSIDETRGPSDLIRARPLVGGDSEPSRHAVTRSQPAPVRRQPIGHRRSPHRPAVKSPSAPLGIRLSGRTNGESGRAVESDHEAS